MKGIYEGLSIDEIKNLINRYNNKNQTMIIVMSIIGAVLFCALIIFAVIKIRDRVGCECCCDDDFEDDEDAFEDDDCPYTSDEDFVK